MKYNCSLWINILRCWSYDNEVIIIYIDTCNDSNLISRSGKLKKKKPDTEGADDKFSRLPLC